MLIALRHTLCFILPLCKHVTTSKKYRSESKRKDLINNEDKHKIKSRVLYTTSINHTIDLLLTFRQFVVYGSADRT